MAIALQNTQQFYASECLVYHILPTYFCVAVLVKTCPLAVAMLSVNNF